MKIQYQSPELIVFESALFSTTTTLIIDELYILLVDPNWLPLEIDFIADWINTNAYKKEKYLLFTHSDYDHIIGYGKFIPYKTIASQQFVDNEKKNDILNQIISFDDENYIKRDYEIIWPKIDIVISQDPTSLEICQDDYVFYQARGHNSDGIITYNKSKNILIAGDYLCDIEFPYVYDSMREYVRTLGKFEEIIENEEVKMLIPGHGNISTTKEEMRKRIKKANQYLSDLEKSLKSGTEFDLEQLFTDYHFPIIMKKFHEANVALMKKELNLGE